MSDLQNNSHVLIVAPPRWFWEWQDDGQTIAWHDGATLAFQAEILEIIARIGPANMPPLGAILLVLAAFRENWSAAPHRRESLRATLRLHGNPSDAELLETVLPLLERLHNLPANMRADSGVRAEIAAQIFAGMTDKARTKFEHTQLAKALEQRDLHEVLRIPLANVVSKRSLHRDLTCLSIGLASFDETRFRSLIDTGLEAPPRPAPIQQPAQLTGRQVLAKMREDETLGGMARLTQRLLTLAHLPRALDDPEDLPLGGVTDIAPRGSLDRLLLSELAYDNDVLAVRVAMNEALYLRREAPPQSLIRQRRVLIDVGIRMWGVPRVYAMSVGMALAINNEALEDVHLHYWQRNTLHELGAAQPDDWRQLYAALDPGAEPGQAIAALSERAENDPELLEPLIVTCAETVADRNFQAALAKLSSVGCYLAIVNRKGAFQLWLHTLSGTQLLNQAILDIDQLLADPKPVVPLVDPCRQDELPAILYLPQLPLRLSYEINKEQTWEIAKQKLLTLTREGRLLLWDDPQRGAREIARDIPTGRILACAQEHPGKEIELIVGSLSSAGLHLVRLTSDSKLLQALPLQIQLPTPRQAIIQRGIVWIFSDQEVVALTSDTGAMLDRKQLPRDFNPLFRQGRYLPLGQPPCLLWRVVSFDGQEIIFTDVGRVQSDPRRDTVDKIEIIFDSQSEQGPMALLSNGMLYGLESKHVIRNDQAALAERPWRLQVSRDGRRLSMSGKYLFDLNSNVWNRIYSNEELLLEPRLHQQSNISMWTHFESLLWNPVTLSFGLTNRRGKVCWFDEWLGIKMNNDSHDPALVVKTWERLKHPELSGYLLYKTEFADGSTIYKDSRGMLHFRSSDPQIPEFSIVVAGGHAAGWAANGKTWGSEFFLGEPATIDLHEAKRTIIAPFLARLR